MADTATETPQHRGRRPSGRGPAGRDGHRGRRAGGHLHPEVLLPPPDEAGGHVPHVPGRDQGAARLLPPAGLLRRRGRRPGGAHDLRQGEEGPGRGARVPPHQPPPRLPGLRQGRGVPPPGPDPHLRSRREPLRRGEAAFRQADPHQRTGRPGPRALHPVRPLHALRRRARRRAPHQLHRPGRPARGEHLPRPSLRLVLQRQHRPDLPGRRPHRRALPVQGAALGSRAGREHVHLVCRRLPGGRAVVLQPAHPVPGRRLRSR